MSLTQELKSGKLTIYAQWIALVATVILIGNGIGYLWAALYVSIVDWLIALILSLVEFPFIQQCFKKGFVTLNTYAGNINNCKTRALIYAISSCIAIVTYAIAGLLREPTVIVLVILLLANMLLYSLAVVRGEPLFRSFVFGSGNMDDENPSQVPAPDI